MELLLQPSDWLPRLVHSLASCDSFWFARTHLHPGDLEGDAGRALIANLSKLDRAFLPLATSGDVLKSLYGPKLRLVRLPVDSLTTNLFVFQRKDGQQALLGVPSLRDSSAYRGVSQVLWNETLPEPLGAQFARLKRELEQKARLADKADLERPDSDRAVSPFRWRRGPEVLERLDSGLEHLHRVLTDGVDDQGAMSSCSVRGRTTEVHEVTRAGLWVAWQEHSACYRYWLGSQPPEGSRWAPEHALEVGRTTDHPGNALFARGKDDGLVYLCYRFPSLARSQSFWTRFRGVAADLPETGERVAMVCEVGTDLTCPELAGFLELLNRATTSNLEDDEDEIAEDFLAETPEQQCHLVHEILVGRGPIPKEIAVRLVAEELRNEGRATFVRLDQRGKLWSTIEATLGKKNWFDKPQRNFVRAVLSEAVDYDDDDWWSYCLMQALGTRTVDRDELVCQAYFWAREWMGLGASFSRVKDDIRGALHQCLRTGDVIESGKGRVRLG